MKSTSILLVGALSLFCSHVKAEAYRHMTCWSFSNGATYFTQVFPKSRVQKFEEFADYIEAVYGVSISEPSRNCYITGVEGSPSRQSAEDTLRRAKKEKNKAQRDFIQTDFPK